MWDHWLDTALGDNAYIGKILGNLTEMSTAAVSREEEPSPMKPK